MKKIFLLLALVVAIAANSQLRVANISGQDLKISIGNKAQQAPNQGLVTFQDVRLKEVWLTCKTASGDSYTFLKKVSRKGYTEILAEDVSAANQLKVAAVVTEVKKDTVPPVPVSSVKISELVKQKK